MRLRMRQRTRARELGGAVVTGLLSVLEDQKRETSGARGLTGVRAVAAGAALYGAGFAAFKGRRLVRNQLSRTREDDQAEGEPREEAATETHEQRDEPAAGAQVKRGDAPDASEEQSDRRAAREKAAGPSLALPQQRWTRMAVSRE